MEITVGLFRIKNICQLGTSVTANKYTFSVKKLSYTY